MIEITEWKKKLNAITLILKKNNDLIDKCMLIYKKCPARKNYFLNLMIRLSDESKSWIMKADELDEILAKYK